MRAVRARAPVRVPAPAPGGPTPHRHWQVIAHTGHPVAAPLGARGAGPGAAPVTTTDPAPPAPPATATAVLLGTEFHPGDNGLLLRGIAEARRHRRRLVLVHLGAGGTSLVRAAMEEDRTLRALSIELPERPSPPAVRTAVALARTERTGPEEIQVDQSGRITTTRWCDVDLPAAPPARGDLPAVVITGGLGGLGIRAATVLSDLHHMHPVLIDRRRPAALDRTARRYLRRLAGSPTGVSVRTADLTDARQVSAALAGVPAPVCAVIHCAGVLRGGTLARHRAEDLACDQAVKVAGLRNLVGALDPSALRHLVVFGSVLAEWRPHHLGSYALANELLWRAVLRMSGGLPVTATVVAQWAVWAGAGMAHELGVVRQAERIGMAPIPLGPGLAALRRLLAWPSGPGRAARLILTAGGDGDKESGNGNSKS